MNASPLFDIGSMALGYVGNVASWRRPNPHHQDAKRYEHNRMLVIQTCASTDDGAHTPAASVTLSGREALLDLRAAIDEALKESP